VLFFTLYCLRVKFLGGRPDEEDDFFLLDFELFFPLLFPSLLDDLLSLSSPEFAYNRILDLFKPIVDVLSIGIFCEGR